MKGDVFWLIFMVFQSINWFQSLYFDGIYLEVERDFAMDFSYIVYYKPSPLFYSCLILIYSKDIQHVVSYSSPFPRGKFSESSQMIRFSVEINVLSVFHQKYLGKFPLALTSVFIPMWDKKKWLAGDWFSISILPCNYNGALSFSGGLGWHYK